MGQRQPALGQHRPTLVLSVGAGIDGFRWLGMSEAEFGSIQPCFVLLRAPDGLPAKKWSWRVSFHAPRVWSLGFAPCICFQALWSYPVSARVSIQPGGAAAQASACTYRLPCDAAGGPRGFRIPLHTPGAWVTSADDQHYSSHLRPF
eukprot:gene4210-biopygen11429